MKQNNQTRETLQFWLDSNGMDYPKEIARFIQKDDRSYELKKILGHLWNCTDIVPARYCEQLDIPIGSSYAKAVRDLFKSLSKSSSD